MSSGRGRGYGGNNMAGQNPHDNHNRRELRRPMGDDNDDLSRGMARMDPFNYGQYGNGGYGMPNQGFDPPRPAPSADGWSSGEDFMAAGGGGGWNGGQFGGHPNNRTPAQSRLQYGQQQFQQQPPHLQWGPPPQQQWNIGASEFVPKSNLSVAAREFVPSNMPRNTSQWAYQQHQHQPDFNPYGGGGGGGGFGGHGDHYGGGGHFGGGGSSNSNPTSIPGVGNGARYAQQMAEAGAVPMTPPNRNVHYDPSEVLSDAIATVVFMPSKFDRTTVHLAEKFNSAVGDAKSLRKLVDSLLEQCIKEQEFQSLAGKLWTHLAQNVTLDFEGVTLKSLLIEKCVATSAQVKDLLKGGRQDQRARSFVTILTDFYLLLVSDSTKKWKVHNSTLAESLHSVLYTMIEHGQNSKDNWTNLTVAAQKLKACGKTLEGEEKYAEVEDANSDEDKVWSEQKSPKMDELIGLVENLLKKEIEWEVKKAFEFILETRSTDRWAKAEEENAKASEELAKSLVKTAPRKSAAIKIEPDPNDVKTTKPVVPTKSTPSGQEAKSTDKNELTEEEIQFMANAIGEEEDSDCDDINEADLEGPDGMTEDIADAYEQFLAEQSKASKNGK